MRRPSRGLICNYVCHMQEFKRAASIHSTERKNCIWFCCCSRLLSLAFTVFVCSRSFVFIQSNPFVMFSTFILTQHFSSPRRTQKKNARADCVQQKFTIFSLSFTGDFFFVFSSPHTPFFWFRVSAKNSFKHDVFFPLYVYASFAAEIANHVSKTRVFFALFSHFFISLAFVRLKQRLFFFRSISSSLNAISSLI